MKSNASLIYNCFLVVGDFLALVAAFVAAYIARVTFATAPFQAVHARTYLFVFLSLLPFWIIIFAMMGLYDSRIYEQRFAELGRLAVGSFIGLLFVISYSFASPKPIFPARIVLVYAVI